MKEFFINDDDEKEDENRRAGSFNFEKNFVGLCFYGCMSSSRQVKVGRTRRACVRAWDFSPPRFFFFFFGGMHAGSNTLPPMLRGFSTFRRPRPRPVLASSSSSSSSRCCHGSLFSLLPFHSHVSRLFLEKASIADKSLNSSFFRSNPNLQREDM